MSLPPDSEPQRRQDEVEVIHGELRRRILHNEVAAGARINQAVLARDLQVSRGPVREALRLLQREGLVEHVHQQQMRVSSVSLPDLEGLYAMHIFVEAFAASLTVPKLTATDVSDLESLVAEMGDRSSAGDIDSWEVLQTRFHIRLISHAGDRIIGQVKDFAEHCTRHRRLYVHGSPRGITQATDEYAGILEAVQSRDPALVAARLASSMGRTALTVLAVVDPEYNPSAVRAAIRWVGATNGVHSDRPGLV